jgi:hypothetical protein
MNKRDIGQEILDGIREIKQFKRIGGHLHKYTVDDALLKLAERRMKHANSSGFISSEQVMRGLVVSEDEVDISDDKKFG